MIKPIYLYGSAVLREKAEPADLGAKDELKQLVADLFACPMADTAPSGKKIITIVKPEELLK